MRSKTVITFCAGITATLMLTSCDKSPQPTSSPAGVAQVGETVISEEAVKQKLAERQRANRFATLTAADREVALDELVQVEALFNQAKRAGWHTNAELLAAFKKTVIAKFKEEQLAKARPTAPSDAEVLAFYDQNASRFTQPAKLRAAIVVLETPAKATPEKRAEHAGRAAALRETVAGKAADFAVLARQHSVDQATRYLGGDFGLLTREEIELRYGTKLGEALALAKPDELTGVIETPQGLAFAKLIEQRPRSRRPLAEVRGAIVFQITQARQAQAERDVLESAKKSAQVTIHRAALERIPLPAVRNDDPPSMPGAETAQLNP